jgi:hypothetical protein
MLPLHSWNEYYSAKNIHSQLAERIARGDISSQDVNQFNELAERIVQWENKDPILNAWETPGYTKIMSPLHVEVGEGVDLTKGRAYKDILQFPLPTYSVLGSWKESAGYVQIYDISKPIFDQSWEDKAMTDARRKMEQDFYFRPEIYFYYPDDGTSVRSYRSREAYLKDRHPFTDDPLDTE